MVLFPCVFSPVYFMFNHSYPISNYIQTLCSFTFVSIYSDLFTSIMTPEINILNYKLIAKFEINRKFSLVKAVV